MSETTTGAHAGQLPNLSTILAVDALIAHWGQPHVTDDSPCFCHPSQADGVVVHRRMPWETPLLAGGEA